MDHSKPADDSTATTHETPADATPAALAAMPENEMRAAYERTAAARAAITPTTRRAITFDLVDGTVIVLKALPVVQPYREVILDLGVLTAEEFDALHDCAVGAWYAHTVWVATARPAAPIADLLARAMTKRDELMDSARPAARRGQIEGSRLPELESGRSAREVSQNLGALCVILRDGWPKMVGQTALTVDELTRSERLAAELFEAMQLRDGTSPSLVRAADERLRAGSVLLNRWDEVRRALTFHRWHEGDVDVIAPSLFQRASAKHDEQAGGGGGEDPGPRVEPDATHAGEGTAHPSQPRGGGGANGGASGRDANGGAKGHGANGGSAPAHGDVSTREGMPNSNPLGGGEDDQT